MNFSRFKKTIFNAQTNYGLNRLHWLESLKVLYNYSNDTYE